MRKPVFIYIIIFLLFTANTLFSSTDTGENLEIRLFIIGPGDPVYSYWGHTGLAIKDNVNRTDLFFDFGNFYFEDDDFFTNFAVGRLLYMAYVTYTEPYIRSVMNENRDLTEYVLDIPAPQKEEMYRALLDKSKPENRTYLYHHYFDNCSTRIRDYINIATNGELESQSSRILSSTYRNSFLRFTNSDKLTGSFLSLLQGTPIDREISLWEEMFLPRVMGDYVKNFTYKNSEGQVVKLVKETNILNRAEGRPALPERYKRPLIPAIVISLFLSAGVLILNVRSLKRKSRAYGVFSLTAAVITGILGSVLLFLAVFTNHSYSYNNLNLFMINPIALFVIPAALLYMRKGESWRKRMEMLWLIQFISAMLMILLKITTPIHQDNLIEIIIYMPLLLSLTPLVPAFLKRFNLLREIPDKA